MGWVFLEHNFDIDIQPGTRTFVVYTGTLYRTGVWCVCVCAQHEVTCNMYVRTTSSTSTGYEKEITCVL